MNTTNGSNQNRSQSAIETATQLAALFETEAEWNAADQTRVMLYHLLRGRDSAASRILQLLSHNRTVTSPATSPGPQTEIVRRLLQLGSILTGQASGKAV